MGKRKRVILISGNAYGTVHSPAAGSTTFNNGGQSKGRYFLKYETRKTPKSETGTVSKSETGTASKRKEAKIKGHDRRLCGLTPAELEICEQADWNTKEIDPYLRGHAYAAKTSRGYHVALFAGTCLDCAYQERWNIIGQFSDSNSVLLAVCETLTCFRDVFFNRNEMAARIYKLRQVKNKRGIAAIMPSITDWETDPVLDRNARKRVLEQMIDMLLTAVSKQFAESIGNVLDEMPSPERSLHIINRAWRDFDFVMELVCPNIKRGWKLPGL